jgi:hypothetical protein
MAVLAMAIKLFVADRKRSWPGRSQVNGLMVSICYYFGENAADLQSA